MNTNGRRLFMAHRVGSSSLSDKAIGPRTAVRGPIFGGAEGTRTPDPLHAMEVRYQLRHSPVGNGKYYPYRP